MCVGCLHVSHFNIVSAVKLHKRQSGTDVKEVLEYLDSDKFVHEPSRLHGL